MTTVVQQFTANTAANDAQPKWLSTASLQTKRSRNSIINGQLNTRFNVSNIMFLLMIYLLPFDTSLGILNAFSTRNSLDRTLKAIVKPMPTRYTHLIHPKWLRPKGRNTVMKRVAMKALWSLSFKMVVLILSAKVLLFCENRLLFVTFLLPFITFPCFLSHILAVSYRNP